MPVTVTDETIEIAGEKLLAGKPLTRREERLLAAPQGNFVMQQVRAIIESRKPTDANDDR